MAKITRTVGSSKKYETIGRSKRYDGMYIGYVKENTDVQKMGRLRVWIPEFGSKEDSREGWFVVSYSSPFAGATSPKILGNNEKLNEATQTSYGFWAVVPDLDNQVIVMFANGDPSRGVFMGCLYQQFMNNMVPGIAGGSNYQFPFVDAPMAEYNKNTTANVTDSIKRPANTTTAEGINAQGLIKDPIRGPTTASARRESPSSIIGLLSPGPANPDAKGKRLGGSQFYMDDGEGTEKIRIRTKSGAQFLLDETNGIVYAINKLGTSWMQMDAEGNFDIFAAKSVSVRSQEDVNFRGDRDVNIEAGRNINIKARNDYLGSDDGSIGDEDSGTGGGDIIIQALNDLQTTAKNDVAFTITDGNFDFNVAGNVASTVGGTYGLKVGGAMITSTGGTYDLNASGAITISTGAALGVGSTNFDLNGGNLGVTGNLVAKGSVFAGGDVKTSSIGLNGLNNHTHIIASGSSAGKTKPYVGSGGSSNVSGPTAGTASDAAIGTLSATNTKTNVLATFVPPNNDTREEEQVLTIVGRFLTFEPCPAHTNNGGQ